MSHTALHVSTIIRGNRFRISVFHPLPVKNQLQDVDVAVRGICCGQFLHVSVDSMRHVRHVSKIFIPFTSCASIVPNDHVLTSAFTLSPDL